MEGSMQTARKQLQNFSKFPQWIIEYVWAHNMMDLHQVLDASLWPETFSQPLSLGESWRLRVVSAQVYSIVKNRNMEHFERAMGFLEATHTLVPRLVTPIKHMKIMFGLKTMAIMWMLREGRGMVDTVLKINQFFPSKLPQYQDQCNQREMFLMRKNHLDFKSLASSLAMDKGKLEDYVKNQMEEQYGEHYAHKVEDRLLHYLHQLEAVLPEETYIDKILKKQSPVTEEERLLSEVITSDSTTVTTTLKKLLHCDVASCSLGNVSMSTDLGKSRMENSQIFKSGLYGNQPTKALLKSVKDKSTPQCQPEVFREGREAVEDASEDSPLLLEKHNAMRNQQIEEDGEGVKRAEDESSDKEEISQRSSKCIQEASSSPQFCSKHQRWVNSILQHCPDECSEELLLQATLSSSPPLFQSSSSTTTSQDLTPSDLIPCPPDQQHAAQASKQANTEDKLSSGSSESASYSSQTKPLPQLSSSRDALLPARMLPVVRLVDIASVRGINLNMKPHQASPNQSTMSSKKQAAFATSPRCLTSGNNAVLQGTAEDSTFGQPESKAPTGPPNTAQVQIAPESQDASTSTSWQLSRKTLSRLSRKFKRACKSPKYSQAVDGLSQEQLNMAPATFGTRGLLLPDFVNVSGPPAQGVPTSTSQSGTLSSVCTSKQPPLSTESPQQVVPQISDPSLPCSTVVSSTLNCNRLTVRYETSRVQRAEPRLSRTSQAMLLQSKLLQPSVSLTRLSAQECHQVTEGRCSARCLESEVQVSRREEEEEDADSSFDVNVLYSSYSSNGDNEDSLDCDPNYKPCIKKKRLLLEYEAARSLNQI